MNYWFNDRYNGNLSGKYPLRIPFTISTIDFKTSSLFIVDGLLYSVSDNELCIYDENGLEKKESIGEGVSLSLIHI